MMKIVITTIGLICSLNLIAGQLSVEGLNLDYNEPSGKAFAKYFKSENHEFSNTQLNITKEGAQYRMSYPEGELILDQLDEYFYSIKKASVNHTELTLNSTKSKLSVGHALMRDGKKEIILNSLEANCSASIKESQFLYKLLSGCIKHGDLNINKVELNSLIRRGLWLNKLIRSIESELQQRDVNKADNTVIENTEVRLRSGVLSFETKTNLAFNVKLKGEGHVDFNESSSGATIRLRLDKVKAGFFNVTSKVFDTLAELNSENILVNRPYITIELTK